MGEDPFGINRQTIEGIEKKTSDFAAEVMAQASQAARQP